MANLKINRLEIRLKGIAPQAARASVANLGRELLAQFEKQQGLLREKRAINIDKIDAGTFQVSKHTSPADLQGQMARRIVESVGSSTKSNTTTK